VVRGIEAWRRPLRGTALLWPSMLFWVGFFAVPIGIMLLRAISDRDGFTLAHFTRLAEPLYVRVLANTVVLGLVVTALTLVIGYPVAYFIVRRAGRWKGLLFFLILCPLLVSIIIRSYGWLVLLGSGGLVNALLVSLGVVEEPVALVYNWIGVVISLVHVLLPFMILSITSVLEGLDRSIEEAAQVLGASPARVFCHVTVPLTWHGILAGSLLVFMLTVGNFVNVMLLGGADQLVLPLLIYQRITVSIEYGFASALSLFLLLTGVAALIVQGRLAGRRMVA
jgi:putative spermidine/putrescine transport system permease protein